MKVSAPATGSTARDGSETAIRCLIVAQHNDSPPVQQLVFSIHADSTIKTGFSPPPLSPPIQYLTTKIELGSQNFHMECIGKSLSTDQEVTAMSDLPLSFERNVNKLEVAAMVASRSSTTNSKEPSYTNKGPSDADGNRLRGLLPARRC